MNTNKLEEVLIETIQESKEGIGKAVEWVTKQMPDLCEQYLTYNLYKNVAQLAMWTCYALVLFTAIYIAYRCLRRFERSSSGNDGIRFISLLGLVLLIPCFFEIPKAIDQIIKIKVAPKVYLVEFAHRLVK